MESLPPPREDRAGDDQSSRFCIVRRGDDAGGDAGAASPGVVGAAHGRCDAATARCPGEPGLDGDPPAGCSPRQPGGLGPPFAHGDPGGRTCAGDPGCQPSAGLGVAPPMADPAKRAAREVGEVWRRGRVAADPWPWKAGPSRCVPGSMSRVGVDDGRRRIDLCRWLGGRHLVRDAAASSTGEQQGAARLAQGGRPNHGPPRSWPRRTQDACAAASTCSLATGVGSGADSIDLVIADGGVPSLGHRRLVMSPPLDRGGVGCAAGFSCPHVGDGGNQPSPLRWQAAPSPGPSPLPVAPQRVWSIRDLGASMQTTVQVHRLDDGSDLPVKLQRLPAGCGSGAIGFARSGGALEVGRTHRLMIGGLALGTPCGDGRPVAGP